MPKFEFEWTEELFYRTTITADTKQEAIDLWSSGEYDTNGKIEPYDYYTQESIDITELEDTNG
jgi:hypothetical protein